MANELSLTASLLYVKNGIRATDSVAGQMVSVAGNAIVGSSSYAAPTADTALPLGGVTAPRYLWIRNLDSTNFVVVKTGVGGTLIAKLLPGDICLVPLDPSIIAPSTQADTAPVNVHYLVFPL